jgi:hypothetical protein
MATLLGPAAPNIILANIYACKIAYAPPTQDTSTPDALKGIAEINKRMLVEMAVSTSEKIANRLKKAGEHYESVLDSTRQFLVTALDDNVTLYLMGYRDELQMKQGRQEWQAGANGRLDTFSGVLADRLGIRSFFFQWRDCNDRGLDVDWESIPGMTQRYKKSRVIRSRIKKHHPAPKGWLSSWLCIPRTLRSHSYALQPAYIQEEEDDEEDETELVGIEGSSKKNNQHMCVVINLASCFKAHEFNGGSEQIWWFLRKEEGATA